MDIEIDKFLASFAFQNAEIYRYRSWIEELLVDSWIGGSERLGRMEAV